jgi:hypothetical protein
MFFPGLLLSLVFINRSVKPMIPFKGVLISWLILARNSDLALLAASAYSSPYGIFRHSSLVISSIMPSI